MTFVGIARSLIGLSSTANVRAAISSAEDVEVLAYTLARGPVLHALEAAAVRGAHVKIRLEGAPYGDPGGALALDNRRIVAELARCGADARLAHTGPAGASEAPVHAKALVADRCLFLDDRNWGADDFVVADTDADDLRSVMNAVDGNAPRDGTASAFAIQKRGALAREAELLATARPGDDVIVESESFGASNPVCVALDKLGRRGLAPRLIVSAREAASNERERKELMKLAGDGVSVRLTPSTEKFTLVADRAWIGSANASPAFGDPDMIDWGLCTGDRAIVDAARERVEARWETARGLPAQPSKASTVQQL
ncbi:MAG: hypothetical protein WB615_01970 [Candidatus Tumulicola sp.]